MSPNITPPKMSRRLKQTTAVLFLLLVTVIYFSSYFFRNTPLENPVTEIFFADRITPAHLQLIEKYNQLHKGKVKVIPVDFPNFDFSTNERKELLARALRGKETGIDILAVDLIWVQRFAKWCEPLESYFSAEDKNQILTMALQSCYYEGELYAVPFDLVQGVMYYREDLVRKLKGGDQLIKKIDESITWEEFIKVKETLNPKNDFYIYPAAGYEGLICSFTELLLSLRPKYFEEEGFNFITPEAQKSLQLLVDLVNKYNMTPPGVVEFTEIPSYEYFIKSDALFIRGWPTYDKDFLESPFDTAKERRLRKAPLPHFKDGKPASVFGGWNLMVSKFSGKKAASVDFIKFLLSEESQEVMYKNAGYYPVIKSIYSNPEFLKKYPDLVINNKLIESGVHRPMNVEYTRYSETMSFYFEQAIRKKITVADALEKVTTQIKNEAIIIKDNGAY